MAIFVRCECGRYFEAPDRSAGRLARCPHCGRDRAVPKPAAPAEDELLFIGDPGPPRLSGKAVASLVLGGLLALLMGVAPGFLFLLAIPVMLGAVVFGMLALGEIGRGGGRLAGRGWAGLGIVLGATGGLLAVLDLGSQTREAPRRAMCVNNLKQIGLALHSYHEAHGSLPPAAIADQAGRPLLSWRVALLPYLDQGELYAKFRLDEPWDGPHNRPLIAAMPSTFACPSDRDRDRKPGMANYQVVVGPAAAFRPDFRPVRFEDVADGLEATLLVGESRQVVPWTKPDDRAADAHLASFGLGGAHPGGFNACFADTRVRFLKQTIDPKVLAGVLTRGGGEAISDNHY